MTNPPVGLFKKYAGGGEACKRIVRTGGKILLIITHDYEFIQTICSRVLVLEDGKISDDLSGAMRGTVLEKMKGAGNGTGKK